MFSIWKSLHLHVSVHQITEMSFIVLKKGLCWYSCLPGIFYAFFSPMKN
uniref:Uncharacterized protein n=1 Tax=Arundo donax TaxID=35708 RepID=A0A0A8ZG02_ARUDO